MAEKRKKQNPEKVHVCLLFGGRSAEHEVSLRSAAAIYSNLDQKKFSVTSVYIGKGGMWKIVQSPLLSMEELSKGPSLSFLPWEKTSPLQAVKADIYFPILHGPYGEDGTIQGVFEMADVPYVGAGVTASAVGMDKALMKTLFKVKNLPVVQLSILYEGEWLRHREGILRRIEEEYCLPFFVKPATLGSSLGISKVKDFRHTQKALNTAFAYDQKILVEEGIIGRELECSVLGNDTPEVSLPGEIIPYREFYDYRDKYIEGKTAFAIPAELPASTVREIQRISIEAYRAIDCSGMARVDFLMEGTNGTLFLSEINTIPGFTEISMYPKLWEVSGLPFPRLVERLIELGFERHRAKKRKREDVNL